MRILILILMFWFVIIVGPYRPSSIWVCACRNRVPMQMYSSSLTQCWMIAVSANDTSLAANHFRWPQRKHWNCARTSSAHSSSPYFCNFFDFYLRHSAVIITLKLFPFFGRCVLAVNVMFVIIGSIYTSVVTGIDAKAKAAAHSRIVNSNANQNGGSNHHNSASVTVNMDTDTNQSRPAPAKCAWKRYPIVDRFFSCFSLSKNSSIITTDYLGSDSIEVIHGMR